MQGGSTGDAKVVLRLAPPTPLPPEVTLSSIPTTSSHQAGSGREFKISAQDTAYTNSDFSTTFTYQWQYSTDSGNNWINIDSSEGGTASTLTRYKTCYYNDDQHQIRCEVVATNTIDISTTAISNVCTLGVTRIWAEPNFALSGVPNSVNETAGEQFSELNNLSVGSETPSVGGNSYTYRWQYSSNNASSWNDISDSEGGNTRNDLNRYRGDNRCYFSDNTNQVRCKVVATNNRLNAIYYEVRGGSGSDEYSKTIYSNVCGLSISRNRTCPATGWSKEIQNQHIGNSGTHSQHDKYNVIAQWQLPVDICRVKVYFHSMWGYGRCVGCNGPDGTQYGWKMKMVAGVYWKNSAGEWQEGLHSEIQKESDDRKCGDVGGSKKSYAFYDNATGSGNGSTWERTDENGEPVTPYVFVAIRGGKPYYDTECKECAGWGCQDQYRDKWQWMYPATESDHNKGSDWYANIYYQLGTYEYETRP